MALVLPAEDYVAQGHWANENISEYLRRAVRARPDAVAVVDRSGRLTYRELDERVRQVAGALRAAGIGVGDVVSFQLPNWTEALVLHQALAMIRAVSNPIIPIYRHKEVGYILSRSETRAFVIPSSFRGFDHLAMARSVADAARALERIIVVDKDGEAPGLRPGETLYSDFVAGATPVDEPDPVAERDLALLLYTSGTTADPKGVLHSHNTLIFENHTIIDLFGLGPDDVVFMPSPVTHITGLLYGLELPAMIQGTVVLQDVWDARTALETMIRERATWTLGATPFLRGLVREVRRSGRRGLALKACASGGADVPAELIRETREVLGCFAARIYGSSEYPTLTGSGPDDPPDKGMLTDGRALPAATAKVLDDDGRELGPGEVGELAGKGPDLCLGYLQGEHNAAFRPDGYFLTGDLASMDRDGYVTIRGRKKDIIIRGGENVSIKEVEDLLYEHAAVDQVAVVAMPDPELGEKGCAYVVPRQALTLDELSRYLLERGIAKQKLPERLELIDEMPMTSTGKIQKYVLKDRIRAQLEA